MTYELISQAHEQGKEEQSKMLLSIVESLTYGGLTTTLTAIAVAGTVTLPIIGMGAALGFGLWMSFRK